MEPRYMVIQMDTEIVVGELVSENKFAGSIPGGDYVLKRAIRVKEVTTPSMSSLGKVSAQTVPSLLPFLATIPDLVDEELEVTVPVTDRHWRCLISKEQYEKFRKSFRRTDSRVEGATQMPGEGKSSGR